MKKFIAIVLCITLVVMVIPYSKKTDANDKISFSSSGMGFISAGVATAAGGFTALNSKRRK